MDVYIYTLYHIIIFKLEYQIQLYLVTRLITPIPINLDTEFLQETIYYSAQHIN